MSQRAKRILNAFLLGFAASLLALAIESWADVSNAVAVGDWISLKNVFMSVAFGAILAGFRAIQAYLAVVPSPEPEENAPSSP
jgi:TRAP-type C4-dicarboxylate transport system permease small subunit